MTATTTEPAVRQTETGGVVTLTLSNPLHRNAITRTMWKELTLISQALAARSDVRVVVIRGEGKVAFASGADISEFGENRRESSQAEAYHASVQATLDAIESIQCPVIAQIHGFCIGAGTAIALACDIRFMDDTGRFGIPAAKLGIGYSPVWIRSLSQVVGKATAAEILMSAKVFDSEKALRCGFANEVRSAEELEAFVAAQVEIMAKNAPLTLAASKICLRELSKQDTERDWSAPFAAAERCATSRDYQIALTAFSEKRTPRFTGE